MTTQSNSITTPNITSPIVVTNDSESTSITTPMAAAEPVVSAEPAKVEAAPAAEPAAVAATSPEPSTEVSPEPAPPAIADNKNKDVPEWMQKRINEITFEKHQAKREAQAEIDKRKATEVQNTELQRLLAAKGGTDTTTTPAAAAKPGPTQDEIDAMVNERAAQMAAAQAFNKACNDIVDTGKKEFKDTWEPALRNLTALGAIGQDVPQDFLETAIELKSPHKVLHHLGSNLDEAERIIKLSPKKMALELARVEAQLNAPAAPPAAPIISTAPAPVVPIAGGAKPGAASLDDPNISMEQFMELRAKQKEEHKNRYKRV